MFFKISPKSYLLLGGALFSALLLYFTFKQFTWDIFVTSIAQVQPLLLTAIAPVLLFGAACRAARWAALNRHFRYFRLYYHAVVIGSFLNYILPLRGGEVIRIYIIHRSIKDLSIGQASITAIVDRTYDLLLLLVLLILTWNIHGSAAISATTVFTSLSTIIFIVFACVGLIGTEPLWSNQAPKLAQGLPKKFSKIVVTITYQVSLAAKILRHPKEAGLALIFSTLATATDLGTIVILFEAFNWNLPITAGITTLTLILLGNVLPSGPAHAGVWQIASILALGLYGLEVESAVAFSVIDQLVHFFLLTCLAIWALSELGFRYSSLRKAASQRSRSEQHTSTE